jgi:hypothetical protein
MRLQQVFYVHWSLLRFTRNGSATQTPGRTPYRLIARPREALSALCFFGRQRSFHSIRNRTDANPSGDDRKTAIVTIRAVSDLAESGWFCRKSWVTAEQRRAQNESQPANE